MLDLKHSVYLTNKCVRVASKVLVKERQLMQQHFELLLFDCFKNESVVLAEKEKLTASSSAPSSLTGLV